ncbi:helix-turn-helix domain-containing protein [Haladaptatus sp. NG-SE-30]
MPQATLKIKSNEALVALSEQHPETEFKMLGAWPTDGNLRVLVETYTIGLPSLKETLSSIPTLTDVEIRHSTAGKILFEVGTPTPPPHGAMADSGVVPSFPLRLENGWFVGDITASRKQLSACRDELDAGEIEYHLVQISGIDGAGDALTNRQQEVVELAVEHGYYDSPRRCTLSDLADRLDVNKSVVSRILQRAEGHIITEYCSSC